MLTYMPITDLIRRTDEPADRDALLARRSGRGDDWMIRMRQGHCARQSSAVDNCELHAIGSTSNTDSIFLFGRQKTPSPHPSRRAS